MANEDELTQPMVPQPSTPGLPGQIRAGMALYDAQGERLGEMERPEPGRDYVIARTGRILKRDLYIPLHALAGVDTRGVHLTIARLELDKLDWYLPPTDDVDVDTPYAPSPQPASMTETGEHLDAVPSSQEATAELGRDIGEAPSDASVPEVGPRMHRTEESKAEESKAGQTAVHKEVLTEPQSLTVPVAHEELRVERRPVVPAAALDLGPELFVETDMDVPLMGERVELEKRARIAEELVLNKVPVTEERTFTEDVRRERVRIDDPDVHGLGEQETLA